jgi:ribosome-associated translation inhibitor RaiA
MQITVTARHCEIEAALEARARSVAERVAALAVRPTECTVVFDVDGVSQVAELRLRDARGESFIGKAEAENHRTALDRAEEKLRRQLQDASGRARRTRRAEAAEG